MANGLHAVWLTLSILTWLLGLIGAEAQSLLPVTAKGSKFFDTSGKQFYIKGTSRFGVFIATMIDRIQGMVYAYGGSDPARTDKLADTDQCALDAPLMQTLLVNTIRVYTVNNNLNHTACMNTFKSHGIYVLLSLGTVDTRIVGVSQAFFETLLMNLDTLRREA